MCLIIEENQERPVAVVHPQPPPPIVIPDEDYDDDDDDEMDSDNDNVNTMAILHIMDNIQNALTNAQTQLDMLRTTLRISISPAAYLAPAAHLLTQFAWIIFIICLSVCVCVCHSIK